MNEIKNQRSNKRERCVFVRLCLFGNFRICPPNSRFFKCFSSLFWSGGNLPHASNGTCCSNSNIFSLFLFRYLVQMFPLSCRTMFNVHENRCSKSSKRTNKKCYLNTANDSNCIACVNTAPALLCIRNVCARANSECGGVVFEPKWHNTHVFIEHSMHI